LVLDQDFLTQQQVLGTDFAHTMQTMSLFAIDSEISELEGEYARLGAGIGVPRLVALAWHTRQRDSSLALSAANEAQAQIIQADSTQKPAAGYAARLALLRGEIRWLEGDADAAGRLIQEAQDLFAAHGDSAGIGDCCWISSFIANTQGKADACDQWLVQAESAYASSLLMPIV
jgi:hypothetical protein